MLTVEELYSKLKPIRVGSPLCEFTLEHCRRIFPAINRIEQLKRDKNAIILVHNYVAPEILYGVADHTGDSYGLAKAARDSQADVIVFPAVRFMAETAKILNPEKTVIDPNPDGGCSLADGISAHDVARLRKEFPHHTFVCYINTTAEVKALCDVCVTSSNVYSIIEAIENDNIYFLPDKLMAMNVIQYLESRGIRKNISWYDGTCYVHEEYAPDAIDFIRTNNPGVDVLVHPECQPEVVRKADYVGSTTNMLNHVRTSSCDTFFLLTECGLTGILQSEFPDKQFVGTCTMCKYMKANSLDHVLQALEDPRPDQIIQLTPEVQRDALRCVERMFEYMEKAST
ncbi:MAG: quinolinate synthase NadA [Nitrospinaceae bacterium]|nr:quinolinate synthase NadA [Nitrospinaceae bacterium]NIR56218.1 quinolinate synthase NadA [Nitrospinaceae bacterium]NIS86674.1 quinolinate synthase NadA [Nitrospinaceae bacterium]NIT83507.1 quinolinate synthase NadA [Nitrospinaceae bacterium]NIU45712.1 quinolinate synthase NadA [Nitrospinaceae bacterium]